MRKLILLTLLLFNLTGWACEHCNIYLNLSPMDYKSSFGIFMRTRTMLGEYDLSGQNYLKHTSHGTQEDFFGNKIKETYQIYEIRGDFSYKERWRTIVVMPLIQNAQFVNDLAKYNVAGVGDPMVLQRFQLFNSKKTDDTTKVVHRLTIGAGVKIPLGKIDKEDPYGTPNLDLQPGTGSWDCLFSLSYMIKKKKLGIILNSNFKLNTPNINEYQYGNTLNVTSNVFYMAKVKKSVIVPFVGVYSEFSQFDKGPEVYYDTGGKTVYGDLGLRFYRKNILLTTNVQHSIYNNLNGANQLVPKTRVIIGINYFIK